MGIEVSGGFVNGMRFSPPEGDRFYGNFSVDRYNRRGDRWVFGAEYLQRGFAYRKISVPTAQFSAEGGYFLTLLSDPSKTLFLTVGASALAGYETLNWGQRRLYDGATLMLGDGFIYGGAISLEIETFIIDKVVFVIRARERVLFGAAAGKYQFLLGIGVKIIIN